MKKTILSIALSCLTLAAFADVVPSGTALSTAKKFTNSSSLTLVWDGTDTATKSGEDPAFYVYNVAGGGWVIVSAEDSSTPILGYSETGSFNVSGMPSNMKGWLDGVKSAILQARKDRLQPSAKVKSLWSNPRVATKAENKVILETASWDQGSPYNGYLSTYVKNSDRGVTGLYTGCVATAMSEVLRYHKWPEHGTGTIGGYTTESKSYTVSSFSIEDHTYDWDNMPLTYSSSATTAQKNAVAQLMADCGIMVNMDYTTSGSGALGEDILPALTQHMQYSKAAHLEYFIDHSASDWMDMIIYDIDNCGPILYAGVDGSEGGHQFVCSGYDADNNMLYINWGWSGDGNGFFTFDMSMSSSYSFNLYQKAIFGLVPDKDGSTDYPSGQTGERLELDTYSSGSTNYYGLSVTEGTIAKGETFMLEAAVIYNMGSADYSGDMKVVLVDKNGDWKEDISENLFEEGDSIESGYGTGISEIECTINGDIAFGDRVAIWYLLSDGTWTPVKYDATNYDGIWTLACVDVTLIKVKDSYKAGDRLEFSLIPCNKRISSVTWSFDGKSTTADLVSLTSGTHTVSAAITYVDSTKETVNQTIVVK